MNDKIYIHEFIDIIGHNRAKYMHHMTANWCPVARDERNQLCVGVWGTVGSTGRWPEVVNLWELDGWAGLAGNFRHELSPGSLQDPSLAAWWATAASLRRGGVDRILVPEPWTRTIDELVADGVRGDVYAHELVSLPPGRAGAFLEAFGDQGRDAIEGLGLGLDVVGAYRVAMVNDSECIVIWAIPDWDTWTAFEQAWLGGALAAWQRTTLELGADWRRILLVDSSLNPMHTGRQPQIEDRRPLEEV